jgi:hypothetical protein
MASLRAGTRAGFAVAALVALAAAGLRSPSAAGQETPWPSDVPNFKAPEPGEHPRLLFRKSDLPKLRARAKTPEGEAILKRLRACLNGSDGESMPKDFNPEKGPVNSDGAGNFHANAPLGSYTFSHVAGFGFLYQMTGDKKYAELGRQCYEKALEGYRDRDRRYSYKAPYGPLRAGPALGWTALGYDLCYDGWDEATRKKICLDIANYAEEGGRRKISLASLAQGDMPPFSNHFGMQTGGAALALLAVNRDPGVNQKKIDDLLAVSQKSMIRNLTEGFGDGGFYAEGDGTGSMASQIAFLSALQAWRVAGGKDFVAPRPNAQWTALKWIFLTVVRNGKPDFWPMRGAYPHNVWARADKSGAGYFAISLGALHDDQRAALLWYYNHYLKDADAKAGTPFDTVSPYPHLPICAFVNWPFDLKERNPAEVIPRCYRDSKWSFYAFRNRWQDENDLVVSVQTKNAHGYHKAPTTALLEVAGYGKKLSWVKLAGEVTYWQPAADGSGLLTMADGAALAVDFSKASGADGMLVTTGPAEGVKVDLGGTALTFKFLTACPEPKPQVQGDKVVVGDQTVSLKDGRIVLGKMAGPWKGR